MHTGSVSFLCTVQKTFTPTSPSFTTLKTYVHIHTNTSGCSMASTFREKKSNIIFPFEPRFVVQWNHFSMFYKISANRDNVMQDCLNSLWTWGHGRYWRLLSLEMLNRIPWKTVTISEEDWYLFCHIIHIPKESSLWFRKCLKITRWCITLGQHTFWCLKC
jgi:hypothetical protein